MKKIIIKFIEWFHLKIFGHPIGPEMKKFIVNLFWSTFGGGLAALIVLGVNVFAGRLMGPTEYGKYNLVLVVVNYLLVPIYFGLDIATIRAIAKSKDKKEASKNISSAAPFIFCSLVVVLSISLIFRRLFAGLFSTEVSLINYALIFTIFMVFKNILDGYIRGIHSFKYQFIGRIIETCLIVSSFFLLFVFLKKDIYTSYLIVLASGASAIAIFYLIRLRSYFGKFNFQTLRNLLSHGKYFVINSALLTVFLSLDKLVINKYLDPFELGLYGAYYTASFTLITQLSQMFNNVFFPSVAKNLSRAIFTKIEKLFLIGFAPMFIAVTLIVFVLVKLFGSKYGLYWSYVLIFGFMGTIQVAITVYGSIIMNFTKEVFRRYLWYYHLINLLTVIVYIILIYTAKVSILNISLALIINYILQVIVQRELIKKNICDNVYANQ